MMAPVLFSVGLKTISFMNNRYHKIQFLLSARDIEQLPFDEGREVAFAGRSNAGKSSALNVICQQKSLARTSKTPGRTQMINFFQIEPAHYLVDLPGYGYAKVPEAIRRHWRYALERYFNERQALCGLILLMDVRHPLTDLDQQMLGWCNHRQLPVHILLTKADKLKRGPAATALQQVRRATHLNYPQASVQLFSALVKIGVDEARGQLDKWLYPSS